MLTLYRLKQNTCFKFIYKWPYFMKNMFLTIMMIIALFIIYLMYFRADVGNLRSIYLLLNGSNSSTFNFLESHKEEMLADRNMIAAWPNITTMAFFSNVVRMNRPCKFLGLAKEWKLGSMSEGEMLDL